MLPAKPVFSKEIFRFFRELGRQQQEGVDGRQPRALPANGGAAFPAPAGRVWSPAVLELDARFDVLPAAARIFSRINRDIRFAKDKTPYHLHMYVKFFRAAARGMKSGQLYVGIAADSVTAGFRIYGRAQAKAVLHCVDRRAAHRAKSAMADAAKSALGQEIRKLLVLHRERRMDQE